MDNNKLSRTVKSLQTIDNFVKQFGDDIYVEILLEEVFRHIMEDEKKHLNGLKKK